DLKMEKKSSDLYVPDDLMNDSSGGKTGWNASPLDLHGDEESPLVPSSRVSHLGRNQLSIHKA
ncbi:probable sugar phosphate phosphate translocator At3g17430, partial [Olea europaea subsp. europaea]